MVDRAGTAAETDGSGGAAAAAAMADGAAGAEIEGLSGAAGLVRVEAAGEKTGAPAVRELEGATAGEAAGEPLGLLDTAVLVALLPSAAFLALLNASMVLNSFSIRPLSYAQSVDIIQ